MLSQTYSLNRQTSTVLGSGSFGVVEKARSEDRVVGLDLVVWGSLVKWSVRERPWKPAIAIVKSCLPKPPDWKGIDKSDRFVDFKSG